VDLPNGIYKVKVYSGDLTGSTNTTFTIEGNAYPKISSKNAVNTAEYIVTVIDGTMNINFGQSSGLGSFNGLEITSVPVESMADTTIKVAVGAEVTLPTSISAVLHDDSIRNLNVTWNNAESVDTTKTGLYTLEGTVSETTKKAKAYIYIADITVPSSIEFIVGSPITLPETVTADYGSGTEQVPVVWSGADALTEIGTYTLTGAVEAYNTTVSLQVAITEPIAEPRAQIKGTEGKDGWYTSEVEVEVIYDVRTAETQYSFDGVNWITYASAFTVSEAGNYIIALRSLDGEGMVLTSSQLSLKVDNIMPKYQVSVNGNIIGQNAAIEDCENITFEFGDSFSGLKAAQVEIDGVMYDIDLEKASLQLGLAGKVGIHNAVVTVEDIAGNKLTENFMFEVRTSINSMQKVMESCIASGKLSGDLVNQLTNNLKQAQHQIDKGRMNQAAKHMENFIKHLNNKALSKYVSEDARVVLNSDAEALVELWTK
jgi:hypothetical protein